MKMTNKASTKGPVDKQKHNDWCILLTAFFSGTYKNDYSKFLFPLFVLTFFFFFVFLSVCQLQYHLEVQKRFFVSSRFDLEYNSVYLD